MHLQKEQKTNISKTISTNKNPHSISIVAWNIQGLGMKLSTPKVQKVLSSTDVIILSETWTDRNENPPGIDGYQTWHFPSSFKHPRAFRSCGGQIIYISNKVGKGISIVKNICDHFVVLKFDKNYFFTENDMYIICCYLAPDGTTYVCTTCCGSY